MILYIGDNFTDDPSGRYYTDGDGSGEEFREEVLKPVLDAILQKGAGRLVIDIDTNVLGYGSSFLVEAFGGLIKHGYFERAFVKNVIQIQCSNPDFTFYENKIQQYIDEAKFSSESYKSTKNTAIQNKLFKGSINKGFVSTLMESCVGNGKL